LTILAVAVVGALQHAPHALQAGWQEPVLERRAISERARLPGEHRHVMPRVVDRRATAKAAPMFAGDYSVLADHDTIGIGFDLDRPADGTRGDRVLVVVEPNETGLHRLPPSRRRA
jgi:hypothetical protein